MENSHQRKIRKLFTCEEKKKIEELLEKGYHQSEIAEFLGRHRHTVRKETRRGLDENGNYKASISIERKKYKPPGSPRIPLTLEQITRIKEGIERGYSISAIDVLAKTHKRKVMAYMKDHGYESKRSQLGALVVSKDDTTFEQRIIFLEEQVKILSETLKEILCRK